MSCLIKLEGVSKSYSAPDGEGNTLVLKDISLRIAQGSFSTFFGPNGCGKSTLMSIVGQLETYDKGELSVSTSGPGKIAFVFQDYRQSLLPWKNVEENILFPLRLGGISRTDGRKKLEKLVEYLDFDMDYRARTYTLSGGQAQLTGILRALVTEPEILVLDEPFSALDYQTNLFLREKMLQIRENNRDLTILFVSHDLDEALFLGDEAYILSKAPARIVGGMPLKIPFGHPRSPTLLTEPVFGELKAKAFSSFQKGILTE